MAKTNTATGKGRRRQMTTGDRGRFYPGESYLGVIVDHDYPRMTYTVNVDGQPIVGCRDMTGPTAALFGFKTTNRLTPGTMVRLVYGQPSWIVGTTAFDPPDMDSFGTRITTGTGMADAQTQMNPATDSLPPHNSPDDLYQGEFEITNLLGTFIRFMTFMASIGAGDRAKIECHLLRDLVRVVSSNYEHFSSNGDFKIFNDGRLTTELNGTTYEHERWGNLKENDPKFEMKDTGMPEVDPLDTGRWRYTCLLGFIGDLFNSWFTDPPETVGRLAEECMRGGKARLHIGQDGALLAQSCSEIVLERVTRVQVPIRIRHEEDPKGVLMSEMKSLDSKFLKLWDDGGQKSEHHTLYKIREYARHLSQYHSLARLHQLDKDWKVPSESQTPAPKAGAGEDDRDRANSGRTYWKDCYATIRIFRDGSTLTLDAYGNAMSSGPAGIQHSSPRDIQFTAAGDIVLKAGGSLFASARRHLEFAAHRGALLLKARTSLRALCEVGTLWLKSDYDPDKSYTPEDGDPAAEIIGNQAIRVQGTSAESWWISKLKSRFMVQKSSEALELVSEGEVLIDAAKDLNISVKQAFTAVVRQAVKFTASSWKNWIPEGWSLDRVCEFKPGGSKLLQVEVQGLKSRGPIAGPKILGQMEGDSDCCYRPHVNHIMVYENSDQMDLSAGDPPTPPPLDPPPAGFSWKALPTGEYQNDKPGLSVGKTDFQFEPLAQQTIRLADDQSGYGDWPGMADRLRAAPQTLPDVMWPGAAFTWLQHNPSAPSLQTPTDWEPLEFSADAQTKLTKSRPTFKFLLR